MVVAMQELNYGKIYYRFFVTLAQSQQKICNIQNQTPVVAYVSRQKRIKISK